MQSGRALTLMMLSIGTVGGCDMTSGKAEPAASCAMAPSAATAATAASAGPSPGVAQPPPPVDAAQITQRSVSTIVEQMSFQLCTARVNRWIDDEYYRQEMTALRKASFSALGVKTPDEPAAPAASAPEPSPSAPIEDTNPR